MASKEAQGNELEQGGVGRLLFKLAVPAITAQVVNMLYNIVDRIYIGHMPGSGALALTGVGVTFPLIMLISAFSALIGMGGAPRASIRMGEHNNAAAEKIMGNCLTALVGISVVLTAFFLLTGEKLLLLFGASSDTIPYGLAYMNIYVCGTLFVQVSLGMNNFITAQGFAKTSMLTVLIGAVINIVLDPIFIFVLGMGVRGAALATILSQAISAIWVLCFLCGKKTMLRVRMPNLGFDPKVMGPVLALGVSPFIMQATESLLNVVFNSSLQSYGGDLAVGAMTILTSLMQMMMMPLVGLTQGAQPIISYNFGARNDGRVRHAFRLTMLSAMLFTTAFWALLIATPSTFISMFTSDTELIAYTSWAMRIYMGVTFMFGAQIVCQRTFLSIGEAKASLFLALLRKIILLIPLIYLLPLFFENKVFAIFLAEPAADLLATLTTIAVFIFQFKRALAERNADQH